VRGAAALAFLLIPFTLCACTPKAAAPAEALGLDCTLPFDVQAAKLAAQAHLTPAPHAPGEPYDFYSTEDGRVSYLITEKGAPGHPAILMQRAGGGQVTTTGCPYGDPKGYKQVLAYLDSLKTWTRR
jgi:hypothetical protein